MSYTTFTISWETGPTVRIKIAHVIKKKEETNLTSGYLHLVVYLAAAKSSN